MRFGRKPPERRRRESLWGTAHHQWQVYSLRRLSQMWTAATSRTIAAKMPAPTARSGLSVRCPKQQGAGDCDNDPQQPLKKYVYLAPHYRRWVCCMNR